MGRDADLHPIELRLPVPPSLPTSPRSCRLSDFKSNPLRRPARDPRHLSMTLATSRGPSMPNIGVFQRGVGSSLPVHAPLASPIGHPGRLDAASPGQSHTGQTPLVTVALHRREALHSTAPVHVSLPCDFALLASFQPDSSRAAVVRLILSLEVPSVHVLSMRPRSWQASTLDRSFLRNLRMVSVSMFSRHARTMRFPGWLDSKNTWCCT